MCVSFATELIRNLLSLSSDRARNRVENADVAQEAKFAFYFTLFGLGGATCYSVKSMRDLQR